MSRFRQEAGAVGTTQPAPRFRALLSTEKRGLRTLRIRMRTRRAERERARRGARYRTSETEKGDRSDGRGTSERTTTRGGGGRIAYVRDTFSRH